LIANKEYFVLHAPRRSGKTTFLKALTKEINEEGRYCALYCSLATLGKAADDATMAKYAVNALRRSAKQLKNTAEAWSVAEDDTPNSYVSETLSNLCAALDKPLALFFDEADSLTGDPLITFLQQLRDGYINRDVDPFPSSLALIGIRRIRDYKAQIKAKSKTVGSPSPFNIAESLTLFNFTRDETAALYGQHTEATGQAFEPEAVDRAWRWTEGQPWLVNALAKQVVEKDLKNDFSKPVTAALIDGAATMLMKSRPTHLDSLLDKLTEPRVRAVIEPMLYGGESAADPLDDDAAYCVDLGLVKEDDLGDLHPANPIYASLIFRTLNSSIQAKTPRTIVNQWMDGKRLDLSGLLKSFQKFWAKHSEMLEKDLKYKHSLPHLTVAAFMQRALNGGGTITPEYSIGRGRVDICAAYAGKDHLMEIKLLRKGKSPAAVKKEGLTQLSQYMDKDRDGTKEGWLVVFDLRPGKSWDEKLTWTKELLGAGKTKKTIHVVGC
jgi:hypothetical protein